MNSRLISGLGIFEGAGVGFVEGGGLEYLNLFEICGRSKLARDCW
jgi:hypothetical protein